MLLEQKLSFCGLKTKPCWRFPSQLDGERHSYTKGGHKVSTKRVNLIGDKLSTSTRSSKPLQTTSYGSSSRSAQANAIYFRNKDNKHGITDKTQFGNLYKYIYFLILTRVLNDPILQRHTCLFSSSQVDLWSFFCRSNAKNGVGWRWEEERVLKLHIALLNALNNLHPETKAQHLPEVD